MREHKYKVWDKHKKVFIPTDVWAIVQTGFNAFGIMLKDWEDYKEGEYFYKDSQELIQFTGLRDRNGREIYEGDIFQVAKNRTYKVLYTSGAECDYEWMGGCFILFQTNELQMPFDEFAIKNGEVIGNIYQNSELL